MRTLRIAQLIVLASLLAGCVSNPSTGRRQLILLSSAEVAAMGVEAKPGLIAEFGGEVSSQPLRSYVKGIGQSLVQHVEPEYAGIEWEFIVLDSDVINAFALPGGKVFITRELLARFDNEAQVAGVLGHEIGHVTGKHIDERLSQTLLAQLGMEVITRSTEQELISAGANLLAQGALLKFGRNQESESDRQGLKYMTAAGYDPHGMLEVLEVLRDAAAGPRPPEILSTHPNPESRIEDVTELLAGPYAETQDNPAYQKYGERFRAEAIPYLR